MDLLWHLQKTMKILYRFRVGALAVAAILHNELMMQCQRCSLVLKHNGLLCNIAWEWFWAFERWEVAYCSCGVYGATCNVLLERWQKTKTAGALAERWTGWAQKGQR